MLTDQQRFDLCNYRYGRLQQAMQERNVAGCILNSPVSMRYAADSNEYALFQAHIPTIYLYVPAQGPAIFYGTAGRKYHNVGDYRRSRFVTPFDGGLDLTQHYAYLVQDLCDLVPKGERIAVDRFGPQLSFGLQEAGRMVVDAEVIVEAAKLVKSAEEILCIRHSVDVAQRGIQAMYDALEPGKTENQILAELQRVNTAEGGDWLDGKMLASGQRTNPWLQEATGKIIEAGDLVGFDTDMIGPNGYLADISRTWLVGDDPTQEQRDAYQHAFDEIEHNKSIVRPGVAFSELSRLCFERAEAYKDLRYVCAFHGCGLSDEYPKVYYAEDWPPHMQDGELTPGMVISVESYSGAVGGTCGVKLEDMVLVTETGFEPLSTYPFEENLLAPAMA